MTDQTNQSTDSGEHGESLPTVLLAPVANFAVAIAKVIAGLVTEISLGQAIKCAWARQAEPIACRALYV